MKTEIWRSYGPISDGVTDLDGRGKLMKVGVVMMICGVVDSENVDEEGKMKEMRDEGGDR